MRDNVRRLRLDLPGETVVFEVPQVPPVKLLIRELHKLAELAPQHVVRMEYDAGPRTPIYVYDHGKGWRHSSYDG